MNPFIVVGNRLKKLFGGKPKEETVVEATDLPRNEMPSKELLTINNLKKEIAKLEEENAQLKDKLAYYKKREADRRRRYRARSNNNKKIQAINETRSNEKTYTIKKDNFNNFK